MGSPAVRLGDVNSGGGATMAGSTKVTVNGRELVYFGASVAAHPCCGAPGCGRHCLASTTGGSSKVTVEGKKVIRVGDADSCGDVRFVGSPNVVIG